MEGLRTKFTITWERRPCFVGEKRAYFHRWIDKETPIIKINAFLRRDELDMVSERIRKNLTSDAHSDIILQKSVFGLIEYEDGTVAEVEPTSIRFDVEREKEG